MTSRCLSAKAYLAILVVAALLLGCGDQKPEDHLIAARVAIEKGDNKTAMIEVKNAIQLAPELAEPRYMLGQLLLKERNPLGAETELGKALESGYSADKVLPELAKALIQSGQAKKLLDGFSGRRLGEPTAIATFQLSLASAHVALGQPSKAQEALKVALVSVPDFPPALLAQARLAASDGQIDAAAKTVASIIERVPEDTEAWKLKGDILLAQGRIDECIASYEKAIRFDPMNVNAQAAFITTLMMQKRLDLAAKQIDVLKGLIGDGALTRYLRAQNAYASGDAQRARTELQHLLRLSPDSPKYLQLAGAIELQLRSLVQAEAYLGRAVKLAPEMATSHRLLIITHLRAGHPEKALSALSSYAGRGPIEPAMYSLAGEVHLQNGDTKRAEQYFSSALKLDPGSPEKRVALAISRLGSGQTDAAFAELQSIAESEQGQTADLALISGLMSGGEFDRALRAIDKLQSKQPGKPLASLLKGRALAAKGDIAGARQSFEKAIALDPTYFSAVASLASIDVAEQNPARARQRFEAMLIKDPKNAQASLALARMAAGTNVGDKEEASKIIANAIEVDPGNPAPRVLLVDHYLRLKDVQRALSAAQSAVAALPGSPEALDALGRAQLESGDTNQATVTFDRMSRLQPMSSVPHLRLARTHIAAKKPDLAEQSLRKALEIAPGLLEAQQQLIVLTLNAKRPSDAIKISKTVQEKQPKAALGFMLEGDIHASMKAWDAAIAAYRKGVALSATSEPAVKLSMALSAAGKSSDWTGFTSSWLKAHPRDAMFLSHLADLALVKKDWNSAEAHYLTALQVRPGDPVLLNNLAWVTGKLRKDNAMDYAERANKAAPNQPAFMDTMAALLADKKDFARALEIQSKAVQLQPENPSLRMNLARILIQSGDKARAKSELESIAKLGDRFSGQAEATALRATLD